MMALHGIRAEVLRHELTSIAEEMALTVHRTARSTAARESGDFSTALMDWRGELLVQGFANGIHVGSMAAIMPAIMRRFGERGFRAGDVVITNDPYSGLSHLPDVIIVQPVVVEGLVRGYASVEMHHSDMGGRFAGGMGLPSQSIYEEGLRLPPMLLMDEGRANESLFDLLRANVRTPQAVLGDLQSQLVAVSQGTDELAALFRRYGENEFEALAMTLQEHGRAVAGDYIRSLRDGEYTHSDTFEGEGIESYSISVTIRVHGDSLDVDFEGTDAAAKIAINVPVGLTTAVVYAVFRCLLGPDSFINAGLMSPVFVRAPEGSLVNPTEPAPVGARGMLLWRIVDVLFEAFANVDIDSVMAGGEGGVSGLIFSPEHAVGRRQRHVLMDLYAGGWGGRLGLDGVDGSSSAISGGMLRALPGEIIEREYPVVVEAFDFVPDREGAGEFRGCAALRRTWRFLADGDCTLRLARRDTRPYGVAGGDRGTAADVTWSRQGQELQVPPGTSPQLRVRTGDVITHIQCGGGGYGDPLKRAPERVLRDVREEKVSVQGARERYGVVISQGAVELLETRALRETMRAASSSGERSCMNQKGLQ